MAVAVKKAISIARLNIKKILGKDFNIPYGSLLHFDGADASTTFTDETGKTWTAYGNAQIDTAVKKFGTGSGLFDGTGDYIQTPTHADHEVGAGNFTIDHYIRFNSVSAVQSPWSRRTVVAGGQRDYFGIFWTNADNTLHFDALVDGVGKCRYYCSWLPSTSTLYHLEFVRSGTNFYIFIDGVSQSLTESVAVGTNDLTFVNSDDNRLTIGRYGNYDGFYFNGWIDEFRYLKGEAKHTANFTPPTSAYTLNQVKKLMGVSNV